MKKKSVFFSFSRRERVGSTLLITSFLLFWVLPDFLPDLFPPPSFPERPMPQQLVRLDISDSVAPPPKDSLFAFDPNKADESTWMLLGLSQKTAQTIIRYREKGGKFRKKEDLARIYSLSELDYHRLEPFIMIPDTLPFQPQKKKRSFPYSQPVNTPVDINRASAEEWETLRGIGPGYAGRILKFRENLGGFYSIDQVGDTYGLPDSVFQQIKPHLTLSPIFRPIEINSVSEEDLATHPYISKKQAHVILLFRENHGGFRGLEDLAPIRVLPDSTLQKLAPYLKFGE
ncbi:MAG: helix-hairpin-helix domain-containing protein [Saprospirales bacterium]|nr:helix-hairpin-helix domain-containing protein [Saprospirales bacterium]